MFLCSFAEANHRDPELEDKRPGVVRHRQLLCMYCVLCYVAETLGEKERYLMHWHTLMRNQRSDLEQSRPTDHLLAKQLLPPASKKQTNK